MVNIFITRKIPKEGLKLLKENNYNIRMYDDKKISREDLMGNIKWADALCSMVTDNIDREIISINPNLKIIANYGAGFNNIDYKQQMR